MAFRKRSRVVVGEGEKSRNQTSDKENESVQGKWLGEALREESPTDRCFLSFPPDRVELAGQLPPCHLSQSRFGRGDPGPSPGRIMVRRA